MNNRNILIGVVAVVIIILVIVLVGQKKSPEPVVNNTTSPTSKNTTAEPVKELVKTQTSAGTGKFLTDASGMTLYVYAKDKIGVSACDAECLKTWKPYLNTKEANVNLSSDETTRKHMSTFKRVDGSMQFTYDGKPLYYYKGDVKPGDTLGRDKTDWDLVIVK